MKGRPNEIVSIELNGDTPEIRYTDGRIRYMPPVKKEKKNHKAVVVLGQAVAGDLTFNEMKTNAYVRGIRLLRSGKNKKRKNNRLAMCGEKKIITGAKIIGRK